MSGWRWPFAVSVMDGLGRPILLRPLTRRDHAEWVRLRMANSEWLRPWDATRPDGTSRSTSFRRYVSDLNRDARSGRSCPFVIEIDERLVGAVTLSSIGYGSLRSASVGYWLARSATGQGTMTRTVAAVIDFAFTELGLHRVEVSIRPENAASLAVVARLGLREEGLRQRFLHIDGDWRDHRSFAVTVEELAGGRLADRIAR